MFGHATGANSVSIVDLTVLQAINLEFSIYALKSPLIQFLNFSFAFVSSSVFLKGVSSSESSRSHLIRLFKCPLIKFANGSIPPI